VAYGIHVDIVEQTIWSPRSQEGRLAQVPFPFAHYIYVLNFYQSCKWCTFSLFLSTDETNNQEGVVGKLSTGHHHHQHQHHQHHVHHQTSSSEEELTSINSCDNQLSSLTLAENGAGSSSDGYNGSEEYNGPFQGRGVALVNCTPSPYDRHALRYKVSQAIS